jgi:zinc transport system substrate-binding protein
MNCDACPPAGNDLRRTSTGKALALLITLGGLVGCAAEPVGSPDDPTERDVLTVAVSIAPQAYLVERVGGPRIRTQVMVGPGASPATYEPKASQLRDLARADVYVSIGVPFETTWMKRFAAANPRMQIVDVTGGTVLMSTGGQPDPHTWLSPRLVAAQAAVLRDALVAIDPAHRGEYDANLEALRSDIAALDTRIRAALDKVTERAFIVFHPSWGYFARDYDLEMIPIEVGGTEPAPAELVRIIGTARRRGIRVVFAQPEFSTAQASTIAAAIGGEVLLISPLERDWLANLDRVASTLAQALNPR